jgi:hypothetical protein
MRSAISVDTPGIYGRAAKRHCAELGGDRRRWVSYMANENDARIWLKAYPIEQRIIDACWADLRLIGGGYAQLRGCVLTKVGR